MLSIFMEKLSDSIFTDIILMKILELGKYVFSNSEENDITYEVNHY